MNDLMTSLSEARPTDAELDALWAPAERSAARDRVFSSRTARPAQRGRVQRRAVLGLAAATAVGFVVVPMTLGPDQAAAQEDLFALAAAAEQSGWPSVDPGEYLHVRTETVQRNSRIFGDGEVLDTNREQWVRWDGHSWTIDTRPSAGWSEYHVFERTEEPSFSSPTPEFAASLPDDEKALGDYLHANVSGSNSHEEAMYVAITDLTRSGFLPAGTLAAALRVLADVDGVETDDVIVDGRPAVEITYSQSWGGLLGRQSVVLDRETGMVLRQHDSDPGGTLEIETTLIEVVDAIPAPVREAFATYDNGERVPH